MEFSPFPRYLVSPTSKYSPQHHVLKHLPPRKRWWLGGPKAGLEGCGKHRLHRHSIPDLQPVASHYSEWAIAAHSSVTYPHTKFSENRPNCWVGDQKDAGKQSLSIHCKREFWIAVIGRQIIYVLKCYTNIWRSRYNDRARAGWPTFDSRHTRELSLLQNVQKCPGSSRKNRK